MDTDIQAKVSAAVRPVNAIQIHPDLARRVIHWLGKYLELMRQPGQPGVPMLLIETQKALAEALAAMDNSRQREQGTSQALEIIVSGYDACVGTAEAARQLGISPDGVRWHCRKRNLESRKVGRQLMVTTSSIENYKRQKVERSA